MEQLLANYFALKQELDQRGKQLEKMRTIIKQQLKEANLQKFENKEYHVVLSKGNRTTMHRKGVPEDIWERYSVCTPFEMISIKQKKPPNKTFSRKTL